MSSIILLFGVISPGVGEQHFRARCCATAASHEKAGAIGTRATAAQRTQVACGLTMADEQQTFEEGDRVASCAWLR